MIKKHLLKIWIITFLTTAIATFLLVHLIEIYRTDHLKHYMPYFTELVCTLISMALSFSFFTVFLNLNKKVRQNTVSNLLSFFLFPTICGFIIIPITFNRWPADLKYVLAMIIPFFSFLIFQWYRFKRYMKIGCNAI